MTYIPIEVAVAAARAEWSYDRESAGEIEGAPDWEECSEEFRAWRTRRMKTAIAAALEAWPGTGMAWGDAIYAGNEENSAMVSPPLVSVLIIRTEELK